MVRCLYCRHFLTSRKRCLWGSVKLGDSETFDEVQLDIPITDGPFKADWASIESNCQGEAEWLREAKVGFWVHFRAAGCRRERRLVCP